MLLKKLTLHNIRSYVQETIEFPKGTVLLRGDIGSGKSTVLLAIAFALFGADTDLLSGQSMLRSGKSEGAVELTFSNGASDVTIYRGLKKSRGSIAQLNGFILKNGTKKEAMPTEMKADVLQMLGYPLLLANKKKNFMYTYTVYCPQEEMKLILGDDKGMRLDIIRKIFGIDKYAIARSNAAILLRELRLQQREQQAKSSGASQKKIACEEHLKRVQHLRAQERQLEPRVNTARTAYAHCKSELQLKEKQWKECIDKKRRRDVFQEQIRMYQEVIVQQENKMKQLESAIHEHHGLLNDDVEKQLREKDAELQVFLTSQHTLAERSHFVGKQITELEKSLIEFGQRELHPLEEQRLALVQQAQLKQIVQHESDALREELDKLQLARVEFEHKEKSTRDVMDTIAHLSVCPTCYQHVSEEHKKNFHEQQQQVLSQHAAKKTELLSAVEKTRTQISALQERLRIITECEHNLQRIEKDIELAHIYNKVYDEKKIQLLHMKEEQLQIIQALEQLKQIDVDSLRHQVSILREKKENITLLKKSVQELEEVQRERQLTEGKMRVTINEIAQLESDVVALSRLEEERLLLQQSLEKLQHEERELSVQYAHLLSERRTLEKQLQTQEEELRLIEQAVNAVEKLTQLCVWLEDFFVPLMETMERKIMQRIHTQFSEPFQKWYGMLVADESMTARIDDTFSPIVEQNGYDIDVSYLSGGERTSAALAYRLALNKVVHDVVHSIKTKDILILDEPTDGFSSEQLDRMRDVLEQLDIAQVIIVSHEQKIESYAEHVLHVVKENGVSRVIR